MAKKKQDEPVAEPEAAPPPPIDGFTVAMWPIDRLIPYARNPRKITDAAIDKTAASIKEFGWRQPIVVDGEDVIIVGHTRRLGAKKLGLTHVPVHVAANLSPAQAKAYRLADNRTGAEAKDDYELLALELAELRDTYDYSLELTAFDAHEIEPLLAADWSPSPLSEDFDEEHSRESGPGKAKTFEFTSEEYESVASAIQTARIREKNKRLSEGAAIELMCAYYLQTGPDGPLPEGEAA